MTRAPQRVAACVCTYRRPLMLAACLDSLAGQVTLADIDVQIVVIDNEAHSVARSLVADFGRRRSPFPVHYVHEPRRGIACARNAAFEMGVWLNASQIVFIDDDEIAAPDWLAQLMAPEYLSVPILLGGLRTEYPEPAPFWLTAKQVAAEVKGREGQSMKTGTTGNVRISAGLIRMGFRFDESLGLMGGEDNELFTRVHQAGFEIRRTVRAVVTETAHPERLTYRGQMYRAYWCAASDMRRVAIRKGWAGALARKAHTVPLNLVFGVLELAASPVCALAGLDAFKRRALSGGKKIARAAGRAAAVAGHLPQPYRNVVGR